MQTYLPAGNDSEIHRDLDSGRTDTNERLSIIVNNSAEPLGLGLGDSDLGANECLAEVASRASLIIAVPRRPVELLDASIAAFNEFVGRSEAHIGAVREVELERDGGTRGGDDGNFLLVASYLTLTAVNLMRTERRRAALESERDEENILPSDGGDLALGAAFERVVDVSGTLDNGRYSEQ